MAICRLCGATVEHLRNYQSVVDVFLFTVESGEEHWEEYDKIAGEAGDFECPECQNVLFTDTAEAIAFLSGEEALK